ncbi:amino acid adenylation domain-containing protein [Nonomuraea wenchangensis]|uniref:non-ribosomal peptide synthetase n=1 Tax=Nonomuraea wenchangensis TaxID=568860 RepID=UPI0034182ECC
MEGGAGVVLRFRGRLDVEALRAALRAASARLWVHEAAMDDCELRVLETDGAGAVDEVLGQERRAGFATRSAVRATLIRRPAADVLVVATNPLATGGWLLTCLSRQLPRLYAAAARGRPAVPAPRRAEAAPRGGPAGEPPALPLPVDHVRPPELSGRGAAREFALDAGAARALGARLDVPVAAILLAAFQIVLSRYTGRDDVPVGLPVADGSPADTRLFRGDLSGDPTVREALARTGRGLLDASTVAGPPPVRYAFEEEPALAWRAAGIEVASASAWTTVTPAELGLFAQDAAGSLTARLEYSADLFEAETIDRLAGHLRQVLAGMAADPDARVSELELLTEAERRRMVVDWNRTAAPYPAGRGVHELVAERARECPDAVAVVAGPERVTYRELDERANQLAHHLRGHGVGPEVPVGVCVGRGAPMIVALLGVMKAGGAYVPLDPDHPPERLAFLIRDVGMSVVVSERDLDDRLRAAGAAAVVRLDADRDAIARHPVTAPDGGAGPDDLAYVIYTSGSTGRPKGVQVEHRSLTARVVELRDRYALTPGDTFLQFASIAFDGSIGQIFPTLVAGARLVVRQGQWDLQWLLDAIAEHEVSVCELPPSVWGLLADKLGIDGRLGPSLRLVSLGGEQVLPAQVRRWFEVSDVPLFNVYGPSETTVTATTATIRRPAERIPIGRPIANTEVFVVDARERPVPVGVVGELWIGGAGVARGYVNRPELTAGRFVVRTVGGVERRLYRTGDLVRWLPDGSLEFAGRIDHQVKIRGHRIEPGEVESALAGHPAVASCAVVAREVTPGDTRLFAYWAPGDGAEPAAADLREWCGRTLPGYMVPSGFVRMDELPLTGNGKIDRAALPAPGGERPRLETEFVPPRTPVEETLARVWAEVLGLDRVGVQDGFFDLGGDSVLSIALITRAREHGIRLSSRVVFESETLAEMAARVSGGGRARTAAGGSGWRFQVWQGGDRGRVSMAILNGDSPAGPMMFCLHEIGGNVSAYTDLAEILSPVARLVGIESGGIRLGLAPGRDLVEMAETYWGAIRGMQPSGPYFLTGYSLGGAVALAVAELAERQGAEVALLTAVDAALPVGPVKDMVERDRDRIDELSSLVAAAGALPDLAGSSRARALMRELNLPEVMLSLARAEFEARVRILAAHTHALLTYRPRPVAAPVLLYQARESAWSVPLAECWRPFAARLDARACAGGHLSVLRPPHVRAVADDLAEVMKKIIASQGAE